MSGIVTSQAPLRSDAGRADGTPVSSSRARAAIVAAAPALMGLALIYHPYIPRLNMDATVAAELTADPTRWALSHLAIGVSAGLLLVAFLTVGSHLRQAGKETSTTLAIPILVVGSTLFVFLPAMELGMLAVHESGGDVTAAFAELKPWFIPLSLAGALAFAIGVLGLAVAIARSGVLSRGWTRFVVVALVVLAVARFVSLGASLYVGGAAGIAALWPLAYRMWRSPTPARD